jgi:hypothetical protein
MDQWSLFIDIEGFSATYERDSQALVSVGAVMQGIHALGSLCYPESPHRLFAHQLGDGFVIVGEFGWETLEQPTTVGIALLRCVLLSGGVAKAAISEGQFADVVGCYPPRIRDLYAQCDGGAIPIGGGLMTILPVMGTALINSYRLLHAPTTPPGPLLLIDSRHRSRLPAGVRAEDCGSFVVIDWVHSSYPSLDVTVRRAGFPSSESPSMVGRLSHYLDENSVSESWRANATKYLELERGIWLWRQEQTEWNSPKATRLLNSPASWACRQELCGDGFAADGFRS